MADQVHHQPRPTPTPVLSSPSFVTEWASGVRSESHSQGSGRDDRTPPVLPAPTEAIPHALPPTLGNYELLEEVARGGMGVVYKARQHGLNRIVALKMVLNADANGSTALERFRREARSAAQLDHPNIVPIYEIGEHNGQPFYTMAYVEGTSLAEAVHQCGPPRPEAVVEIMTAVAAAVGHAHENGIIHRDLKPANVLIDTTGRPRVTDFGLARQTSGHVGLTAASQVVGTPGYMSPEQARGGGRKIGPESDVYSLGCILYYLLTGKAPFEGDTVTEVLLQSVQEKPLPPRSHNPQVPPVLEWICLKCLEKRPEDRFPSARAFMEALQTADLSAHPQIPTENTVSLLAVPLPAPPRKRRSLLFAGLAAVVVLAAVGGAVALRFWSTTPTELSAVAQTSTSPATQPLAEKPPQLKVVLVGSHTSEGGEHLLTEGEAVIFRIEVDRDAHVGIWLIDPNNEVDLVFPNTKENDTFVQAGTPRTIPNTKYILRAKRSKGPEKVQVIASTQPLPLSEKGPNHPDDILKTITQGGKNPESPAVSSLNLPFRVLPRTPNER